MTDPKEDVVRTPTSGRYSDNLGRRAYHDLIAAFPYRDESWKQQAACLGCDTNLFFPTGKGKYTEARQICRGCPVRVECLDYARRSGERQSGMFGGMSPEERHMRVGRRLSVFEDFNGLCRRCGQWASWPTPAQRLCHPCRLAPRIRQPRTKKGKFQ